MHELQTGNTDASAVIFKRYHRLAHITALHILRDAAEAEDLTQSIFLELYRKAGQFDTCRGTLKVWLLQYSHSRTRDSHCFGDRALGNELGGLVEGFLFRAKLPYREDRASGAKVAIKVAIYDLIWCHLIRGPDPALADLPILIKPAMANISMPFSSAVCPTSKK
jgi:hypothetical protein